MIFTRFIGVVVVVVFMCATVVVAEEVVVSYSTSTPTVADVPFPLVVNLNTKGLPTLSYNLFLSSTDGKIVYLGAGKGSLFSLNDIAASSAIDGGKVYRFQVKPKVGYDGTSSQSTSLFVANTQLAGLQKSSVQLKMDGAKIHGDNGVTPSAAGKKADISQTVLEITPVLSSCGDGVVGYIDTDKNGIFDKDKEKAEACDIKLPGGDGCSVGCTYIKKEYRVKGFETLAKKSSCDFGSYNCGLDKLLPRELFKAKVTALVDGSCFPYDEHADAVYCEKGVGRTKPGEDGKLTLKQKIDLIAQLGTALRELLDNKEVVGTK